MPRSIPGPRKRCACTKCGSAFGCRKDQLCNACRLRQFVGRKRKYDWTPDVDARIRREYKDCHSRQEISRALDRIVAYTGIARADLKIRAQRLGVTLDTRRPWSLEDKARLRELSGRHSTKAIARMLGRSWSSTQSMIDGLKLSRRVTVGYSMTDLAHLFGVSHRQLRVWMDRGWLKLRDARFAEIAVERFVWEHMEAYSFNKCDEAWLKGMLNRNFGLNILRRSA